ncbi:hypothetical protein HETIRDRAFT_307154 [Heterobasidion irregulare TC 32-1]|uniref:Uncharacterized protein n=1 Tax=Heterobasidion irregulare (strain TC 32-1) TaxID=747525 RepID=W4KQ36_HETIT|nr:uncharacterized protein HETIRDRAFT_307154 [Heterobasidion irregulare TC 32-1]ETW87794.1 hypothetical protein HETIRDRAFT_307154 [Heterobasidion irregulare TC 32-1]
MSALLSALKTKLGEYMLSLPDGAAEYEDYEAWARGFAKRVAVLDRSARGQDLPELADWITEAEHGLDHMATDDWLAWGTRILPQRAAHFATQQQRQAAEAQALEEESARVAIAEREAEEAEAARAAAALRIAEDDRQRRREALVEAMFDGSMDPEEGDRQMAALEAESVLPFPLFLRSPSPSAPVVSSSHPAPSVADSLSRPGSPIADPELASATAAMNRMSVDLVASTAPTDAKGKKSAAAVIVEFARQQTPTAGRVVLPLGPGTGRMSTVRPPVERNGAGKVLEDPPGLLPGDVLADYACHRCADNFTTRAFRCYLRPGQVSCIKCAGERKGCSFQPGWTSKDKGKGASKGKGKSTGKAKSASKAKSIEKSVEEGPSRPTKRRRVEVLVPERSVGDSIAQNKAARTRKPVKRLLVTTQAVPSSSHPPRSRPSVIPSLSNSSRLLPTVAQGIASEIRYRIAVAEGSRAFLARSIAMWQAELESLEARSGPATSDMVMVEDSSQSEGSAMSESGDFVPSE